MKILLSIWSVLKIVVDWILSRAKEVKEVADYGWVMLPIFYTSARAKVLNYLYLKAELRHVWSSQTGAVGRAAIVSLFVVGILAFVLYMVISSFFPSAETANASIQALTQTDAGTTTSKTFFNIGLFLIPVGIFVTLFIILISGMGGGGGGGRRWFKRR